MNPISESLAGKRCGWLRTSRQSPHILRTCAAFAGGASPKGIGVKGLGLYYMSGSGFEVSQEGHVENEGSTKWKSC